MRSACCACCYVSLYVSVSVSLRVCLCSYTLVFLHCAFSLVSLLLCLPVCVCVCISACVCLCSYTLVFLHYAFSLVSLLLCLSVCVCVCISACLCLCSYTLVFLHYAFSLVCLLLCRPLVSAKLTQHAGTKSIYAALYFLPILICTHAVLAGFICTYIQHMYTAGLLICRECIVTSPRLSILIPIPQHTHTPV